jgi:superfamily II DNA or RNA helicase
MEITEALLAKMAGWEPVKQARALVSAGKVQSSEWQDPILRGMVQEGTITYRAGLKIKSATDAENLCTCRQSRQWGVVCAHSVAVGLHYLKAQAGPAPAVPARVSVPPASAVPVPAPRAGANAIRRSKGAEPGEPAELHLVFPPNLEAALSKGQIMLCLEARRGTGARVPLGSLPKGAPFRFSDQENAILDLVEAIADGETPSMAMLTPVQLAQLLEPLRGFDRATLGKSQPVKISPEPFPMKIRGTLESNGEIVLQANGGLPRNVVRGSNAWAYQDRTFYPLPSAALQLLDGLSRIPRGRVPQFLNVDLPKLAATTEWEANFSAEDFILEQVAPQIALHLEGSLNQLSAKLECIYGDKRVFPGSGGESLWLPDPKSPHHYSTRNSAAERQAFERLLAAGFSGPDGQGRFHLKGEAPVLSFFARDYPKLKAAWKVTLEEKLQTNTQRNLEWVEPRYQIAPSGEQWFDLSVAYSTKAGEQFAPADIQRLLLSGQSHRKLKNGKIALVDTGAVEELQAVLLDCSPRQQGGSYRLNNLHAGFLDASLGPNAQVQAPAQWRSKAASQTGKVQLPIPQLGSLDAVLRPYQKEGVAWLSFLRSNGFGGILADEMGLGKTLQVLALFASQSPEPTAPRLIVCPTSLVFNWAAEAAKFTPHLKVLVLHGPQRKAQFSQIANHDLVVTSYALIRRDSDIYRGIEFDTVVLDEAQHIKNRQTQNAQAVKAIRARHRLVLTGTPLENSVLDLWSIFDFLMPGYLGTAKDFRERYEVPITQNNSGGNSAIQERLGRRLRPFMLRRLKREVAADLPEKIDQVSYCELNEEQRALYQQVLDASRKEVLGAVEANGLAKSRMVILTALLRLRQICCDLRLLKIDQSPAAAAPAISGKVELFGELLEEVIDGGHRVLVFSQFTSMLQLLKERLESEQIEYCYLDGSTKDRGQVVERFQSNGSIPVFLISLKAGGVGLNLTGADTVIHFDPWWNPAVEAQATDRAHRIGQKKVVTNYKLITRGTVEEKILNLQNRKRALLQGMLDGEEQLAQSLNWEEIQELLAL